MTQPVRPLGAQAAADQARGGAAKPGPAQTPSRALVPAGPATTHARPAKPGDLSGDAAFAAHLLGQTGRKRGLKGGPPVLTGARSAYLEAEFSGPSDRRLPVGKMTKTEI